MRRFRSMVSVVTCVLALLTILSGCSLSDTNLSKVVICKSVDGEGKPLEKANTFVAGERVLASVEMVEVPKDTEVVARWFRGTKLLKRETKKTTRRSEPGNYPHVVFSLETPKDWQPGSCKIEVELPFGAGTKVQKFALEKQ